MSHLIEGPRRAPGLLAAVALLSLAAATIAPAQDASPSAEDDRQAVREAHEELISAYASVDVDALAGLLDPSDDLLIYHPRGDLRFSTLPSVRHGLERMLGYVGPATWSDERDSQVIVDGDVAWHTYVLRMEWSGEVEPVRVRGTEIWIRHASGWRLVHAHWSENAKMAHEER